MTLTSRAGVDQVRQAVRVGAVQRLDARVGLHVHAPAQRLVLDLDERAARVRRPRATAACLHSTLKPRFAPRLRSISRAARGVHNYLHNRN